MNNDLFTYIIAGYLIIINIILFLMMRSDKQRAKRGGSRRIPEKQLLGWSALGGALGAWLALRLLRHKTKHAAFAVGLPVMLLFQIALLYALFRYR